MWVDAKVWVVVEPPDGLWIPAEVKAYSHTSTNEEGEALFAFEVVTTEGRTYSISTVAMDKYNLEFQWVKRRSSEKASDITDMTSLLYLNEPEMIEFLRNRYSQGNIYTSIGPILVAINPFKVLPLYGPDAIENYFTGGDSPHVYRLANNAYQRMFIDKFDPDKRENQAILVNGESGAGKVMLNNSDTLCYTILD